MKYLYLLCFCYSLCAMDPKIDPNTLSDNDKKKIAKKLFFKHLFDPKIYPGDVCSNNKFQRIT